jgi:5'-nucleotidase
VRILLTNDDGVRAPGIVALHKALLASCQQESSPLYNSEVFVVAPATVQSATSHGVTFHEPLMTRRVRFAHDAPSANGPEIGIFEGIAVAGRPADCVKVALSSLWPDRYGEGTRPDLVVSGMNAGANCGINVIYSGTVAAAIEAAFLGVPSIAVSLHLGQGRPLFDSGARHGVRAIERIVQAQLLDQHSCVNVNIPRCESPMPDGLSPGEALDELGLLRSTRSMEPHHGDPDEQLPIRVCPMNVHGLIDRYEQRESPGGDVYFWASGHGLDFHATDQGTDVAELIERRHITVTPLWYDMTRHTQLGRYAEKLNEV